MREQLLVVLFITILPLIYGFTGKCSSTSSTTCGEEGTACTINSTLFFNTADVTWNYLECRPPGSKCCKRGLYCLGGTCKVNNIGAACADTSECIPGDSVQTPYACWDKVCKVFGLENDECEADVDCWAAMTCVDNRCVGFSQDDHCESNGECAYGYYCGDQKTCQPSSAAGEQCEERGDTTCITGTFCDPTQRLCQIEYTQAENDVCVDKQHACGVGLICDNATQLCIPGVSELKVCTTDADCSEIGSRCICQGDGVSRCTNNHYVICQEQVKDWRSCLGTNHCGPSYLAGTCAFRSCATQYTELSNCMCGEWKRIYGSTCNYNYCDKPISYQPYQIGIIVIIAIMGAALVITIIVFVVRHFMSPDNPYYQSVELPVRKEGGEVEAEPGKEEGEHFVELHE